MEIWVPVAIPGFEHYLVSDLGRVKGPRKILTPDTAGRPNYRYPAVQLWNKGIRFHTVLHLVVWVSFRGEVPSGYHVDHIDSDRMNSVLSNLQLLTVKENMAKRGGIFQKVNQQVYDEELGF